MEIAYLEIVTDDVEGVCEAYAVSLSVDFGRPDERLGGARTAPLPAGGLVGVRAPLRETEDPVVRPYWLVDDIQATITKVVEAGGVIAVEPVELPGLGTFAIYLLGGNDHGLWQR